MRLFKLIFLHIIVLLCSESYAQAPELEVRWLGGPSMELHFDGLTILTDPMLGEGDQAFLMADPNEMFDLTVGPNVRYHKRITQLPNVDLTQTDLVLLSHAHEDHFDQQAHKQLQKDILMVLPTDDQEKIGKLGFTNLDAMAPGDKREYKTRHGKVTITAVPADHTLNKDLESILGHGLGFYIVFQQGSWQRSLYWTGDSMPSERVINFVQSLGPIDILVPNMGKVGTSGPLGQISMAAKDVLTLVKALSITKVLPIHHSTYELYLEPISVLVELMQKNATGLDLISEGSTAVYQ
ncbi:MBL fold metallo-hydrolase [Thalassotalea sp. 1_MG-2023]|uniref:MBL fold metallo-hydrolase n=1 Tax=Thalassotalea sp. 1_MG-2023 TaxID=3062680 RepID=UPI0026E19F23|nr:MBL fold metallo-hydrolase [Thalassotalea sp. 1_MG-2023]MDO6425741.1 MBL fold metallo-hydrolase [Thalassotalea sp. 1_MG-2023]